MTDISKGTKGVLYWCMETRDWPENWRSFIHGVTGEPCAWMGNESQCKGCRGHREFSVTVNRIKMKRPKK